jgi:hypothetical protein
MHIRVGTPMIKAALPWLDVERWEGGKVCGALDPAAVPDQLTVTPWSRRRPRMRSQRANLQSNEVLPTFRSAMP